MRCDILYVASHKTHVRASRACTRYRRGTLNLSGEPMTDEQAMQVLAILGTSSDAPLEQWG